MLMIRAVLQIACNKISYHIRCLYCRYGLLKKYIILLAGNGGKWDCTCNPFFAIPNQIIDPLMIFLMV